VDPRDPARLQPGGLPSPAERRRALAAVAAYLRCQSALAATPGSSQAARYQHVTDTVRQDVARQVDGFIWHARSKADAAAPTEDDALDPVDRRSLAVALNLAELGLAHVDQSTAGPARYAVEQLRALFSEAAPESLRANIGEES